MVKNIVNCEAVNPKRGVNSFFAGIGGFDLAFQEAGFSTNFYCENNEFCRSVLNHHWPKVKDAGDISKLDSTEIPFAEVWTAGFPCQDLSMARTPHGKRSGLKGLRSGLFYNFLEHVSVHKPNVVLLENVAGLLSSHKGADFRALISSLTDLGYAVAWRVLNARYFGAPQSRPRVFICAWYGSPEQAAASLFEEEIAGKQKNERQGFMVASTCALSGASVSQVSFCISATSGRHTGLDWARSYVTYPNKVRRLTPLECERLQGFPDNWTVPINVSIVPTRGLETNRYHAVGNAVCVPVVRWVASRIAGNFDSTKKFTKSKNKSTKDRLQHLGKDLLSYTGEPQSLTGENLESVWKSGGIAYEDWFVSTGVSSSPVIPVISKFIDVIEKKKVHERYFLSPNAVQGILRRVDKLGRNLFPPLDAVLRKIASKSPPLPENSADDSMEISTKELIIG